LTKEIGLKSVISDTTCKLSGRQGLNHFLKQAMQPILLTRHFYDGAQAKREDVRPPVSTAQPRLMARSRVTFILRYGFFVIRTRISG
jgi:hypothetical protein